MAMDRNRKYRQMAARGKYQRLYTYLCSLPNHEWRASFREIERVIGFDLPMSARLYRPWWSNESSGGSHTQSRAWTAAGWKTAEVDVDAETVTFRRKPPEAAYRPNLDQVWPVHSAGAWPEGLSLSRKDAYL